MTDSAKNVDSTPSADWWLRAFRTHRLDSDDILLHIDSGDHESTFALPPDVAESLRGELGEALDDE